MVACLVTFPVPQVVDLDGLSVGGRNIVESHGEAVWRELGQTGREISQLTPVINTALAFLINIMELHLPGISDSVHHYSGNRPEQQFNMESLLKLIYQFTYLLFS